MTNDFLARLMECASAEGLTHRQTADRLGISESYWAHLRNGDYGRPFPYSVIARAVKAFPRLQTAAMVALTTEEGLTEAVPA